MVTIENIKSASNQAEIYNLVEKAAAEHNCCLSESMTFTEQAILLEEETCADNDFRQIAKILYAAEWKWIELSLRGANLAEIFE